MASPSVPRDSIRSLFSAIIEVRNRERWTDLESYVHPNFTLNGSSNPRSELAELLGFGRRAEGTGEVRIDSIAVDDKLGGVAARLVNRVTPTDPGANALERQEIVFAYFTDGRLSSWQALQDEDGVRDGTPAIPSAQPPTTTRGPSALSYAGLKDFYRAYINSINSQTMEKDFPRFCQPELEHNDRRLSIVEYIPLISDSQNAIEGLHFHIQDLLADEGNQRIAARLEFTGTPVREWGGATPNGKPVNFHEHVVYDLESGKISHVKSVIELGLYREQMS
ncbi:hypothetical protein CCHL11_02084 [Colletotrichum chlorophyti]|uniref:SnoaL-like polyketide cyclase n=1 Tax=Colletotrichum chlorophyti TaxID=708187 RepID=A0A1Q8S6U8_9PEZI|nr:hypothetical protein CCHL11_02084 [Colletotrichum chlorophyti]